MIAAKIIYGERMPIDTSHRPEINLWRIILTERPIVRPEQVNRPAHSPA
jgi:hypothetical protein